jgi:hypothetical protein
MGKEVRPPKDKLPRHLREKVQIEPGKFGTALWSTTSFFVISHSEPTFAAAGVTAREHLLRHRSQHKDKNDKSRVYVLDQHSRIRATINRSIPFF